MWEMLCSGQWSPRDIQFFIEEVIYPLDIAEQHMTLLEMAIHKNHSDIAKCLP